MYNSFIRKNNINIAIILFIVIFVCFIYIKPHFLYNKNGTLRTFGLGKTNTTIFPLWLLVIIIAIISYLSISYYLL